MYDLVRDISMFDRVTLNSQLPCFIDTETCAAEGLTVDKKGLYGKVRLVQLYQTDMKAAIIVDCDYVPLERVLDLIKSCTCVFHNGAYDLHTINLTTDKVWYPAAVHDTLYLSRIKYFTKTKFGFYDCLQYAECDDELIKGIDKKEEQKSDWSGPLSIKQLTYAAADVIYLSKLFDEVKEFVDNTVYQLDIQNLSYAVNYTRNGLYTDRSRVLEEKKKFSYDLEQVLEDLPINPGSSPQCAKYLDTKGSNAEILDNLILEGNEKAEKIKFARHCSKTLNFLKKYDRPIVRGFFQPSGAITGRFSCNGGARYDHDNLQQIPRFLQRVFRAPDGYKYVYKDYSGLELRMAVSYVGETNMAKLMRAGADLHYETDLIVFPGQTEFTVDERNVAKVYNFSLIYGAMVKTMQKKVRLSTGVDQKFTTVRDQVERWFDSYPGFREWHNYCKRQLNVYGYVDIDTALGRVVRTYSFNDALNYPIQGSSVEVQKVGLGLLFSRYPDVHICNTVHDSNILLSADKDADMWGKRLDECMVEGWEYVISELADPNIPMPSGYDVGQYWEF